MCGNEPNEVFSVSEPDSGKKPTFYASLLKKTLNHPLKKEILKKKILKGLNKANNGNGVSICDKDLEDVVYHLCHEGYVWIRERFLIEVSSLDGTGVKKEEK